MTIENKNMSARPAGAGVTTGRIGDRPYWVLLVSVILRALHQIGAAVYLTSFLVSSLPFPRAYLVLAVVSGLALLVTEGMRHRQIYREVSGWGTFIKVAVLGLAYHQFIPQTPAVLGAFILASLCAHLPKEIRHRLLF